MDKNDKIQEGQVQINDIENYRPLDKHIAKETHMKVSRLISKLHRGTYIDDMTRKWSSQTPNPPRIPEFYTLTKIHKLTLVGRPIISGCNGPTERISAFVDTLLQPISISQASYLKDTTDFINFIEKTKVNKQTFLVSMDVTSLYTNIPQEEGITTVCRAYENFHRNNPPIPTQYLKEMLSLILKRILSNSTVRIIYKSTVPQWVLKWPLPSQIFLWPILKHIFLAIASQNPQSGNDILTIFFLCGMSANLI